MVCCAASQLGGLLGGSTYLLTGLRCPQGLVPGVGDVR